jgi:serine protease Do
VFVEDVTPQLRQAYNLVPQAGAFVAQVSSGSPAAVGGIQPGDVIVSFNGQSVDSATALTQDVQAKNPGQGVQIGLYRGQAKQTISLTVGSTPAS